jgi:ATP-dependent DNA helicase PIF1
MVFCGDFCQLAPIKGAFCFESAQWHAALSGRTVYLQEVQRQDNPEFIQLLSEIRVGQVTEKTKKILSACRRTFIPDGPHAIQPTMLYPHRKTGDGINAEKFALLAARHPVFTFPAKDTKYAFASKSMVKPPKTDTESLEDRVPATVTLCIECQVMLTVNLDVEQGLVNGSRGIIQRFEAGQPVVLFDNGRVVTIASHVFEADISTGRLYRSQIPLALAWAMTIHKCQGSTLTRVMTDLSHVFCEAQSYVTLSRVRSLDGLYLLGIDFSKIKCQSKVLTYYAQLLAGKGYTDVTTLLDSEEDAEISLGLKACVC